MPAGIPEIEDQITGTLVRFFEDGLIEQLEVEPEYKGDSFVPAKMLIRATHSGKAGSFAPAIDVW